MHWGRSAVVVVEEVEVSLAVVGSSGGLVQCAAD